MAAFTIRASSMFMKHYLKVKDWGIDFMETAGLGGRRRFEFGDIDYILMSTTHVLSFQVGQEVFSIKTKPNKAKHQLAIQKFQQSVAAAQHQRVGAFPVVPPPPVRR